MISLSIFYSFHKYNRIIRIITALLESCWAMSDRVFIEWGEKGVHTQQVVVVGGGRRVVAASASAV